MPTEAPPRRPLVAGLALVLTLLSGCHLLRYARGPRWIPREAPINVRATNLSEREELTFLIFGDGGTGKSDQYSVGRRMAAECEARGGCDFGLMLGDNIYYSGARPARESDGQTVLDPQWETKFEAPYRPLGRLDLWAVPGNHDWRGSIEAQIAYTRTSDRWRMPSQDYAVPRLPDWMQIYGLDTVRLLAQGDDGQIQRARDTLCERTGWRLLFGHHPIFTSGKHAGRHGSFPEVETRLLEPLIEPCAVQLYFAGHDHHQEHLSAAGFEQVVQGAAGKLRGLREIEQRVAGVEQRFAAELFGFAVAHATPEKLELRFFGYDETTSYGELYCRRFDLTDPVESGPCD